jgi:hypothetical protein
VPAEGKPRDAYRDYVARRREGERIIAARVASSAAARARAQQPPRRSFLGTLWRVAATVLLVPLALVAFFVGPVGVAVALGIAYLLWTSVWGQAYCTGAFPVLPQDHGRIPGDPS